MSWTAWILVAACIVWALVVYAVFRQQRQYWAELQRRIDGGGK